VCCRRCCRRPQNLRANLKKDYKKAVLNGLVLWVPLQYINFRYVPMRWRVLFIDVVHFFWCALARRPCAALAPPLRCSLPLSSRAQQASNGAHVQGHLHVRADHGVEERQR
jgi:hypothetical protein